MQYIKYPLWFMLGVVSAFFTVSLITFFLPSTPLNYQPKKEFEIFNINLSNIFKTTHKTTINTHLSPLRGVSLKAVYKDNKKGFIIIHDKKNVFVDLNGYYKGYKLIKINQNSAIFEKNSKQYILKFKKENIKIDKIPSNTNIEIKKSTIQKIIDNPLQIWDNIDIIKTPKGYQITYIKPNSVFDKIGLKKGDIIIAINNQKLNDTIAWKIYKNIQKYENLDITIKRNNSIKVIHYEIH